jgi:phage-related tail protein
MIPFTRDTRAEAIVRIGTQPIALAAATLLVVLVSTISIAAWRSYSGVTPEPDRVAAARQMQARAAQASEQLVEKAKGLEATQQESIDQLQMVQDQLQTVRRLLAAQQADTRRLSEQVSTLTEAVDGLRHSYASVQSSESSAPAVRNRAIRTGASAHRGSHRRRGKSSS